MGEGLDVAVTLDAIKFKGDHGFEYLHGRPLPMPRCVGGDQGFTPQLLKKLNRTFYADRKPRECDGCSKKFAINQDVEEMATPIALRQGEPIVEHYSVSLPLVMY